MSMDQIEVFTLALGTVDYATNVIRGVSVITEGKARGHGVLIDQITLAQVKQCMDAFPGGVKVKVNHRSGFDGIVGSLRDSRHAGRQLRADFHLLSGHPMRDLILEMSRKQPETFGFSIAFSGRIEESEDGQRYARCDELYSVDLVDEPAANPTGLFHAVDPTAITKATMLDEIKRLMGFAEKAEGTLTVMKSQVEKFAALESANKQLTTDLATARATIITLETAAKEHATQLAAKDKEIADIKASVDKTSAAKALEITAAQGQPPVTTGTPSTSTGGGNDLITQHADLLKKDPQAAMEFYRKNKVAYDLAWKVQQKAA